MIELVVAAAPLFAVLALVAVAVFVRGGRTHDGDDRRDPRTVVAFRSISFAMLRAHRRSHS